MAHKKGKPKKYKPGRRQYLITSKGIIPIHEWPNPGYGRVKKPTLHGSGGLMRPPKLARKGF